MHPPAFSLDPAVAASLGAAAAIAIFLPFVLAFLWKRRTGVRWRVFWSGALVFFVSQVILRIPWQIPLAAMLARRTLGVGPLWTGFLLFSSLTAGIFEETGRWIGYRTLLKNERSPRAAVMYGLGHGGIESALLVGLSFAGLLVTAWMASKGLLPPGPGMDQIRVQLAALTPMTPVAGIVERGSAILFQVALSLIVLQVFVRRGIRWLFFAIGLHFALNALAVTLLPRVGTWPTEAAIAAAAIGVFLFAVRLAWNPPPDGGPELASREPGAAAAPLP